MLFDTAFARRVPPPLDPAATGHDLVQGGDVVRAVLRAGAALALYMVLGLRLARGEYLDYYNLAFDFDPARYVSTFALSPADPGNFKHPLILLLHPLALP